ncbi:hypothetical protein Bbelb_400980 [Branchiostoma belcheri]|nr:hypothetical protein Bbelb_400980 [Branchiostoma belcheri]
MEMPYDAAQQDIIISWVWALTRQTQGHARKVTATFVGAGFGIPERARYHGDGSFAPVCYMSRLFQMWELGERTRNLHHQPTADLMKLRVEGQQIKSCQQRKD